MSGCIGASAPETAARPLNTDAQLGRPEPGGAAAPGCGGSPVQCQPLGCPQTREQRADTPQGGSEGLLVLAPLRLRICCLSPWSVSRCWRAPGTRAVSALLVARLRCAPRLPPAPPAPHVCNVLVCHVVVPSVSEESPSASESGALLSQDPSAKPVLFLPPKKPAASPGDHEDTPVKQLSLLKQPPALPPKPTARIGNHLPGESARLLGARHPAFPSRDPFLLFT